MRILQLGKFYPPHRGGMETALSTLCEGLARRGHELRAVVAASNSAAWRGRIDGVDVLRVPNLGSVRSVAVTPGFASAVRAALLELDPHIVQLHLPNPAAGFAWLLVGDDRPLVISYHSDIVRQRWLARFWEPWQLRLLERAARIVVSTQALLDASSKLAAHRERCRVIPFGIDVDRFPAAAMPSEDRSYFLFVGRLVYYKGVDLLLRALDGTDLTAHIVGDGPLRGKWEALAGELGLNGRARFLGECDEATLTRELAHCSALVLPSTHPSESFGIVQLEAMAAGKPTIVARASAGAESVQVDGETGRLVEARNVDSLRAAMLELDRDAELRRRLGEGARRRVASNYGLQSMIRAYETLYDEVVRARREKR